MGKFVKIKGVLEYISDSTHPDNQGKKDIPDSVTCPLCGFTYVVSPSIEGKGCFRCIGNWKRKIRTKL